jgi:hypothetical protein
VLLVGVSTGLSAAAASPSCNSQTDNASTLSPQTPPPPQALSAPLDLDLSGQAKALGKSVSSLTSSLRKALGPSKPKRPKARRRLFEDDEEDDEGLGAEGAGQAEVDPLGIPPRRAVGV